MALTPAQSEKRSRELSASEGIRVERMEADIDVFLSRNCYGGKSKLAYNPTPRESRELQRRYCDAGWSVVIENRLFDGYYIMLKKLPALPWTSSGRALFGLGE